MSIENDKTQLANFAEQTSEKNSSTPKPEMTQSGTVLSATEVEKFVTQHEDPNATQIVQPNQVPNPDATHIISDKTVELAAQANATVLAGGTEAIQESIIPAYSPKVGIGSIIKDRFILEKLLGRGGMGEVYLATDKRKVEAQDKKPYVAFKVLGENFKRHPQAFIALQRECRKTQDLAHPNIITMYDFDRQGDTVYIIMEALDGKPMDEEIRSEKEIRPLEEALSLITQCATGLAYAHKKDLVHSDLKPGNLFLTKNGTVKLLDFGIARAFKSGKDLKDGAANEKNDTVFDAGELGALTPAYASLEMIEGEEPHPSDDVYALGLIAYELLTGKHPFKKVMANKALEQGLVPEKIQSLNKQQWQALEGALAFKRENRIQNAQEFLDKFTAKSRTPLYVASVIVLVTILTLTTLYFTKPAELGPEIAFNDLPVATQQNITKKLSDANTSMSFKDYDGVLFYLDEAFALHPYNPEVMAQLDKVIDAKLGDLKNLPKETQLKQIDTLMKYQALNSNKKLLDYKESL